MAEPALVAVSPPAGPIYRIARGPNDPFAAPSWDYALQDGTFGNRFDDPTAADGYPPEQCFRVIYCASQRAAAFGETLARFRVSTALLGALGSIDEEESIGQSVAGATDPDDVRRGLVPADWRMRRRIGETILSPSLRLVDIDAGESIEHLRHSLAPLARQLNLTTIDLSAMTSSNRHYTQCCARHIYEQRDQAGAPAFAGIRYLSRLNASWECWAIFENRMIHVPGWPGPPSSFFLP